MRTVSFIVVVLMVAGCSTTSPIAPPPIALPPRCSFQVTGTGEFHLPPQMVIESGLPATVRVSLDVGIVSTPISLDASKEEGHLTLVATDASGKLPIANIKLASAGSQPGSPLEVLGATISRFMDAASLMSRPLAEPTTHPATQPQAVDLQADISIKESQLAPSTQPSR